MRVFTRGVNETLTIGGDVEVTVLEIDEDRVRLGITTRNESPGYREVVVEVDRDRSWSPRQLQLN